MTEKARYFKEVKVLVKKSKKKKSNRLRVR